ncbi:MAG: SufS family cysteine desulfurase [Gemmataceae bacterium]|nr:SufS family cysteine desulfurase [Gemmataceae bacterium]
MSIQEAIQSAMSRLAPPPAFDARRLRDEFPILRQKVHGKPLVYLDNAATTQKPRSVLEAMERYYAHDNANIHRAVHQLSERATRQYEAAREKVRAFLHASDTREIVFTRGATESINLVAQSWGRANLKPGDEIDHTAMEHHSNIVPWQLVAQQTGATVRAIPLTDDADLDMEAFAGMMNPRTKLVAIVHLSNSLGTLNPVEEIIEQAHAVGAVVLIDASQSAAHQAIDVRELGADFLVFSGHKIYGPTGVGVLWGKRELLEAMPPWQGGGDMIERVSFAGTTYAGLPNKFEAGTPNIAGVVGLGAALDWLAGTGLDDIAAHEDRLLERAEQLLRAIPGVRVVGNPSRRVGVLPFVVEDPPLSALDVGTRLDLEGVAVRTGHHCCMPVMERFGLPATVRASFACYNTMADVDALAEALRHVLDDARKRIRPLPLEEGQRCPAEDALCGGTATTCPPKRDVMYAARMADSPQEAAGEITEVFDLLDDWQERYQHLLDLGAKLPEMPEEFKTECTRVHGCQSVVHLAAREKPDEPGVVEFLADSDGELVKGLIALLQHVYSGQTAKDILGFDLEGWFRKLGLDQHLSLNRRNGMDAMATRIRQHAAALA